MDDTQDIFIFDEGRGKAAYQGGNEIARMDAMGYERFLVALYRWIREHGPRSIWAADDQGNMMPAEEIQRELARVKKEQEGR